MDGLSMLPNFKSETPRRIVLPILIAPPHGEPVESTMKKPDSQQQNLASEEGDEKLMELVPNR